MWLGLALDEVPGQSRQEEQSPTSSREQKLEVLCIWHLRGSQNLALDIERGKAQGLAVFALPCL